MGPTWQNFAESPLANPNSSLSWLQGLRQRLMQIEQSGGLQASQQDLQRENSSLRATLEEAKAAASAAGAQLQHQQRQQQQQHQQHHQQPQQAAARQQQGKSSCLRYAPRESSGLPWRLALLHGQRCMVIYSEVLHKGHLDRLTLANLVHAGAFDGQTLGPAVLVQMPLAHQTVSAAASVGSVNEHQVRPISLG